MADQKTLSAKIQICLNGEWIATNSNTTVAACILSAPSSRTMSGSVSKANLKTRTSVTGQARFAVCGMGICQECRVTINGHPHQLACQVGCESGMVVETGGGV